jgi:hypothetical protein
VVAPKKAAIFFSRALQLVVGVITAPLTAFSAISHMQQGIEFSPLLASTSKIYYRQNSVKNRIG